LLEELRSAVQNPPPELLDSITAPGAEVIPALIALVNDPAAYELSEDDDDVSYWAPYPAVRILGELQCLDWVGPLLSLMTWDDYDYLSGEVPEALSRFGRVALDPSLPWPLDPTYLAEPAAPVAPAPAWKPPQPYRRAMLEVGRNDPCPCGSGKKYKKCHGR
jgi:hypothetical protein